MPELPDVEIFKRYLESTALHQEISEVTVHDDRIFEGVSRKEITNRAFWGQNFKSGRRHGKYLFRGIGKYGMARSAFRDDRISSSISKRNEKRPDHDEVGIDFTNGYHLAYDCARKLGKISLTDDPEEFISEKGLGVDALDEELDLEAFQDLLGGTRSFIKSALMNQKLMAGIGNVYSDEILFQAGVYPRAKSKDLNRKLTENLFYSMKKVLTTAVDRKANPEDLPDSYIIPRRGENGTCPKCGAALRKITVSGRTGYYCDQCQSGTSTKDT